MNVLLVGSGGREHALASKLIENKSVTLFIAPGNAGMEKYGTCIPVAPNAITDLCDSALKYSIDLCVVGPEVPLCLGLVDELTKRGIMCFGPSKEASNIEGSKAFSKKLMSELGIPTAEYKTFTDYKTAIDWVRSHQNMQLVVKESGLAAGKGVFLPENTHETIGLVYELFENNNIDEIVIEQRLDGEEISLLSFCDGVNYAVMPSSQDHKRLLDGNRGENTGGMGAFAPVPNYPLDIMEEYAKIAIAPVLNYFFQQGTPYRGVLYAGLMITKDGPKVLEYNCRFGDPETQVLMSLFSGDLTQTMLDCAQGNLTKSTIRWTDKSAVTVVMADEAYPKGALHQVELQENDLQQTDDVCVFHCGTIRKDGTLYSHGGRVLAVTATSSTLSEAVEKAYKKITTIHFPHSQYRTDIAQSGIVEASKKRTVSAYDASGVDIDAGNETVKLIGTLVKQTYTPAVLSQTGSFGGLFDCAELRNMKEPVLVASTDGVGTKVKLASSVKRYASLGMDIVNHCVDDILVQGAKPLFFLDYFATSKLEPQIVAEVVRGMSEAAVENGCALIGGETAEMPGVYEPTEFDIAGTIVGVVEKEKILPLPHIQAGDVLIGFASASPHTNGYSLIRKTFEGVPLSTIYPELECSLEKALLTPHRSYLQVIYPILQSHPHLIKALAHITGGGFYENIPRVLPNGLDAIIHSDSWVVPPLYQIIQKRSNTSKTEMYRVFNQGIGLVAVVAKDEVAFLQSLVTEKTTVIGELVLNGGAKPSVKIV